MTSSRRTPLRISIEYMFKGRTFKIFPRIFGEDKLRTQWKFSGELLRNSGSLKPTFWAVHTFWKSGETNLQPHKPSETPSQLCKNLTFGVHYTRLSWKFCTYFLINRSALKKRSEVTLRRRKHWDEKKNPFWRRLQTANQSNLVKKHPDCVIIRPVPSMWISDYIMQTQWDCFVRVFLQPTCTCLNMVLRWCQSTWEGRKRSSGCVSNQNCRDFGEN